MNPCTRRGLCGCFILLIVIVTPRRRRPNNSVAEHTARFPPRDTLCTDELVAAVETTNCWDPCFRVGRGDDFLVANKDAQSSSS